ncbi:hypothetical protein ACFWA4_00095 [Streptomyces sp. NPDC060011]|uniref:hypothetical protein n=1 Tax=unclassified Streptomyces TaxID=2593676 RepID=UPI0022583532|nr:MULTISPECIES: hypothetical protein [unclassified Streptomyces]MCX5132588.1 hypothetical protein [Streptomyces sp. NBC_00340]WSD79163.1 hypothetical protein OHB33_24165 [Streptomyces sp. NBC_01558]
MEKTAVAWSTRTVAARSRAIAMRGSAGAVPCADEGATAPGDAEDAADDGSPGRAGPGTGAGVTGVASADDADDSFCFDLSGDSPATDASSM